jgi:hypothetical protein
MPVPDERGVGLEQRHRLALHVRAHERAVRVVVLEERDQRRRDRDELLRAHVDQADLLGLARMNSPLCRQATNSPVSLRSSSSSEFACAIVCRPSSVARGRRPRPTPCRPSTRRYGLSMKPYLLIRA